MIDLTKIDKLRRPAVSGTFYPSEPNELKSLITNYLDNANLKPMPGKLKAVIVPHAGYIYSALVSAYSYRLMQLHNVTEPIVILGPSHYTTFEGFGESGYTQWATPLGIVNTFSLRNKYNTTYLHLNPGAHDPEHSLEVQIPFLQVINPTSGLEIDPILTGNMPTNLGSEILSKFSTNHFFVISSDLSHYNKYDDAIRKDKRTIQAILDLDHDMFEEIGDACGKKGISIIMKIAEKYDWKTKLLKYANSGDTGGTQDQVVGYVAIAFYEKK